MLFSDKADKCLNSSANKLFVATLLAKSAVHLLLLVTFEQIWCLQGEEAAVAAEGNEKHVDGGAKSEQSAWSQVVNSTSWARVESP